MTFEIDRDERPRIYLTGSAHWDDQLPSALRQRLRRGEAVYRDELPSALR